MKWNKALGALALAGMAGGCAFDAGTLDEEQVAKDSEAQYFSYWIGPISDEQGPVQCSENNAGVTAAQCRGKRCDNNYLQCAQLLNPNGTKVLDTVPATQYSTKWISEEFPNNEAHCDGPGGSDMLPPSGIVVGMQAIGDWSDQIRLICRDVRGYFPFNCTWSPWFSEENPPMYFRFYSYATGVRCRGASCDEVSFEYCDMYSF
jgi:hypothetical protein